MAFKTWLFPRSHTYVCMYVLRSKCVRYSSFGATALFFIAQHRGKTTLRYRVGCSAAHYPGLLLQSTVSEWTTDNPNRFVSALRRMYYVCTFSALFGKRYVYVHRNGRAVPQQTLSTLSYTLSAATTLRESRAHSEKSDQTMFTRRVPERDERVGAGSRERNPWPRRQAPSLRCTRALTPSAGI